MKHKSDLKHTSTAKARAEDREKKAIKGLRVVKAELRVVKEEFQDAKEELCTKAAALDQGRREASDAESFVELLAYGPPNGLLSDAELPRLFRV